MESGEHSKTVTISGLAQAVIVVVAITVIYAVLVLTGVVKNDVTTSATPQQNSSAQNLLASTTPADPQTVSATINVLQALDNYYVSTQSNITDASQVAEIMTSLLNSNRYLNNGNVYVKEYLNDPGDSAGISEQALYLAASGMTTGSNQVVAANNGFIDFMRKDDATDLNYAIATYQSKQKEGYSLIATSAPQIAYLFWEPAKTENPTGPIPYKISKAERKQILDEIERLFGDDLRDYQQNAKLTGQYNSILFAVDAIRERLLSETYEEASKRGN